MKILVLGGTRFFGAWLVTLLLRHGHDVTVCNRGKTKDFFGADVRRLLADRTDRDSLAKALAGKEYDVVFDNIAYCPNDVAAILDNVKTARYILTSSCSVYPNWHPDTPETDFDPTVGPLGWGSREDFTYAAGKQQAERALFQRYGDTPSIAVRFPFVVGNNDYTGRLLFYVRNAIQGRAMYIDNLDAAIPFIHCEEAGAFLHWCATVKLAGPVNAAAIGTFTMGGVLRYVENKTGKKALLTPDGEAAPYNGVPPCSFSTQKATAAGFPFTRLEDWLPGLLDNLIQDAVVCGAPIVL